MTFHIDDETKLAANNCKYQYSCLLISKWKPCKVIGVFDNEEYFVFCENDVSCTFQSEFEERILCTCPVRKEIYDKYNV